jgi:hypothetical protein
MSLASFILQFIPSVIIKLYNIRAMLDTLLDYVILLILSNKLYILRNDL